MIIGPLFLKFASPFFVAIFIIALGAAWQLFRRRHGKNPSISYTKEFLKEKYPEKLVLPSIVSLCAAAILLFVFSSLNPAIVEHEITDSDARRIVFCFDKSGSMIVGFDNTSSPLPSYEKSRMGRAGEFVKKLTQKRKGDAFALIFFDSEQYASRDFTTDSSQIAEVLDPDVITSTLLEHATEASRLKQDSAPKGTQAENGLKFAREFILSHEDYRGDEILIYVGDLEVQSAKNLDRKIPILLDSFRKEDGIKTYAVAVTTDYITSGTDSGQGFAEAKVGLFEGTDVPVYEVGNLQDLEEIASRIAQDIPPTPFKEEAVAKKNIAPFFVLAALICMLAAVYISEKFPRIP